jgi:hypothetical protein
VLFEFRICDLGADLGVTAGDRLPPIAGSSASGPRYGLASDPNWGARLEMLLVSYYRTARYK